MVKLTPEECRVLGVLTEKAQTTPGQYPMSLNGIVTGCNQKSNRHPIVEYDEERVLDALDGLRQKGIVRQVDLSGSRVEKFRHVARDALDVSTAQLVILAELLLRGPQTVGELRGRASRMHPIESLDIAENVLASLMERDPPLVRELPPLPGSRAKRYQQLLCPDLHPIQTGAEVTEQTISADRSGLGRRVDDLEQALDTLRNELHELREMVRGSSEASSHRTST